MSILVEEFFFPKQIAIFFFFINTKCTRDLEKASSHSVYLKISAGTWNNDLQYWIIEHILTMCVENFVDMISFRWSNQEMM